MIYESECLQCGQRHEYIQPAARYLDTPVCCGQKTEKRLFTAPMAIVDIPAYESPSSGKWITSRAERREDFKRTGCRPWEGKAAEQKEAGRKQAYTEAAQDKALDHTVRTAWANLPDSKKTAALAA